MEKRILDKNIVLNYREKIGDLADPNAIKAQVIDIYEDPQVAITQIPDVINVVAPTAQLQILIEGTHIIFIDQRIGKISQTEGNDKLVQVVHKAAQTLPTKDPHQFGFNFVIYLTSGESETSIFLEKLQKRFSQGKTKIEQALDSRYKVEYVAPNLVLNHTEINARFDLRFNAKLDEEDKKESIVLTANVHFHKKTQEYSKMLDRLNSTQEAINKLIEDIYATN